MTTAVPLLIHYLHKRPAEPGEGLRCPEALRLELEANGLIADAGTVTDGQCGIHAFLISLDEARHRFTTIQHTSIWKQLSKIRTLQAKLLFLRGLAVKWIRAHQKDDLMNGLTVKAYVEATTCYASFADYLTNMSHKHTWADACIMHALAVNFNVDVLIFQSGAPISFVGVSQDEQRAQTVAPFVPVALANDVHWWGLIPKVPVFGSDCNVVTVASVRNDPASVDVDDAEDAIEGYFDINLATAKPQEEVQGGTQSVFSTTSLEPVGGAM